MMMKQKSELAGIRSAEDLQREQRRLRLIIKEQEQELRQRVQKVPGELFYSGVNSVLPTILTGKVTSTVLNAGRNLINKSFEKKEGGVINSKLITAAKQAGVFTILKIAYKAFIRHG
jgi:hypothetical protein